MTIDPLSLLVATAVGALFAGLLGLRLARQSSRQIDTLTRAVEAFTAWDDMAAVRVNGDASVARFASAFTTMRDRLVVRTAERKVAEAALKASEGGHGSTFWFTVPLESADRVSGAGMTDTGPSISSRRGAPCEAVVPDA